MDSLLGGMICLSYYTMSLSDRKGKFCISSYLTYGEITIKETLSKVKRRWETQLKKKVG